MTTLLDTLYKEHTDLNIKLRKVADLIIAYGGSLPEDSDDMLSPSAVIMGGLTSLIGDYPKEGTWKEKILFSLKEVNEPMTANQVGLFMAGQEAAPDPTNYKNMATQYCSTMATAGDIDVEKGHTNKYSIKK